MLDSGVTPLTGRVWFVSSIAVAGKCLEIEDCDDDTLFRIVCEELDLGNVPAIVFDARAGSPRMRYYCDGLSQLEEVTSFALASVDISLDRVLDIIDVVHRKCLVTPDAQSEAGKLWEAAEKYWVVMDAERRIQLYLKSGLQGAFPTCDVREEQPGVPGRLDLEIEESDPGHPGRVTRHAILELKVLRSFGSTGIAQSEQSVLDWVEEGVRQAAAYRSDRGALAAALCCFDMRKTDTGEACFHHVQDLASELEVRLKIWFLFSTAKAFRGSQ